MNIPEAIFVASGYFQIINILKIDKDILLLFL